MRVAQGAPYLVDAAGRPFLIHGDSPWSLIADLPIEDARSYLDDRRRRGFNTLLVNLLEALFARQSPRNFYGEAPFTTPGDFGTPSGAYFDHADRVLDEAEARGMLVLLAPAYLGAREGAEGWYPAMRRSGPDKLGAYGRYLGQRFGRRTNIMWMHGGDLSPPETDLVTAVADGIEKTAPGMLHSAHCQPEHMAVDIFGGRAWLQVNTLYTYGPVHLQAVRGLPVRARMPSFLIESAYEDESGTGAPADARRCRTQAYQALLTGACGHVYGNNPIWHFEGPGLGPPPTDWRSALDSAGARSMTVLKAIFDDLPWWTLVPDTSRRWLVDGHGPDEDWAVAASSDAGDHFLAYLPSARPVTLDLHRLARGDIEGRWIDPATGASLPAPGTETVSRAFKLLEPPRSSDSTPRDWLLHVRVRGGEVAR
ncbi:MAG: DUF4038 domain-containing protein [Hyphomicrobiaceae bacterium]|nr:DUF4038 domain-containing protein [Hyphomicrobiaceae bacterium]